MAIPAILSTVQQQRGYATRFKPGSTPNPGGRPRSAKFRREALKQLRMEIVPGVTRLACIVDGAIERASTETAAATFIRDTVDGKPSSNDDRPTVGTINIAWGAMPAWGVVPATVEGVHTVRGTVAGPAPLHTSVHTPESVQTSVEWDNTVECRRESNTPAEVQLKVLESPRAGLPHTNPTHIPPHTRPTKLRNRVPVHTVPAPTVPVQPVPPQAPPRLSISRMVAERALSVLAARDTAGMSPATLKQYLASVRVAEEALAAL
jgi:hypothetical protein